MIEKLNARYFSTNTVKLFLLVFGRKKCKFLFIFYLLYSSFFSFRKCFKPFPWIALFIYYVDIFMSESSIVQKHCLLFFVVQQSSLFFVVQKCRLLLFGIQEHNFNDFSLLTNTTYLKLGISTRFIVHLSTYWNELLTINAFQ